MKLSHHIAWLLVHYQLLALSSVLMCNHNWPPLAISVFFLQSALCLDEPDAFQTQFLALAFFSWALSLDLVRLVWMVYPTTDGLACSWLTWEAQHCMTWWPLPVSTPKQQHACKILVSQQHTSGLLQLEFFQMSYRKLLNTHKALHQMKYLFLLTTAKQTHTNKWEHKVIPTADK